LQSLHQQLTAKLPTIWATQFLLAANIAVFVLMLFNGAGLWHLNRDVQLAWGANFSPATQEGEWWRLFTAMFLHFGIIHLVLNMWSLWDVGQLVERMFGRWRFICIYLLSGLLGNLLSLDFQGSVTISGGASGAIFGIYAAALVFLWRERAVISVDEFRWLFWGALGFAVLMMVGGFFIPGINNAAHIGGFFTGILTSIVLTQSITARNMPVLIRASATILLTLVAVLLIVKIPAPSYRWSDELLARDLINVTLYQNQAINRSWLEILNEGKQGVKSQAELADKIDTTITDPSAQSFELLSKLPQNQKLPSAAQLERLKQNAKHREVAARVLAKKLRTQSK
jgi:rhomboid protease GluP